jgi:hypothetical protein
VEELGHEQLVHLAGDSVLSKIIVSCIVLNLGIF